MDGAVFDGLGPVRPDARAARRGAIPDAREAGIVILITVRPGPVLHVWRDGREVIAVPLTFSAAMCLLRDLAENIAARQ